MSSHGSLVPPRVAARAHSFGRLPFGFGPRVFTGFLLGFVWLVPAWWSPRLIGAMFLWDLLVVVAFCLDLARLPKPQEIEASRNWEHAPCLAMPATINVAIRNTSGV